jgi:formate/nitrite transporter FocA (FNT family)
MLRLWAIVLVSNLIGAVCIAWVLSHSNAFDKPVDDAFLEIGTAVLSHDFATVLLRGIFAGWLIALIVWLMPAVPNNRIALILLLTWLVGVGDLSHVIAGSIDAMYAVTSGAASWGSYFTHFMFPALVGNTIGGVSLVAALNHAQTVAGKGLRQPDLRPGKPDGVDKQDQPPDGSSGRRPAGRSE